MPANFNDKVIIESNGAIKLNGNTGNNKQAMTSKGNATPEWTDVVNSVSAGDGISVSGGSGDITISNTGVTSITAGSNITISGSTGDITISADDQDGGGGGGGPTAWGDITGKPDLVNKIVAGTNITITPNSGTGTVTINSTAAGGGGTADAVDWDNITNKPNFCDPSWVESEPVCNPPAEPPNTCSRLGQIYGKSIVLTRSGTGQSPAIVWGTGNPTNIYMGLGGSTDNRRIRITSDEGWDSSNPDKCGGEATAGKFELFTFQMGQPQGGSDPNKKWANRTFKPRTMPSHSGGVAVKAKQAGEWNDTTAGSDPGHSISLIYEEPFRIGNTDEVTAANDSTLATFNLETILDTIAADGSVSSMSGGSSLIRWGRLNASKMETVSDDFINHTSPFIDLEQLQNIHPYLVKTEYTADSYEELYDTDGNIIGEQIKPDPADRTTVPIEVNNNILTLMLLVRAKRARDRVQAIEDNISNNLATTTYVDDRFADLIDASPASLDTLNELAAALGDDANFASNVTTQIATKLNADAVSAFGLTLIDDADAATARTTLGLGDAATQNTTAFATAAQGVKADAALPAAGAATAVGATALISLSGVPGGDTDLGGFTGSTITDNVTVKVALEELETAVEERALATTVTSIDTDVTALVTLSGVASGSTDLGTFTGSIVTDNTSVKAAVQELETAIEAKVTLDGSNIPGVYNNDNEAATAGVPVNGIYRNSNGTIHWRLS